MAKFDTTPLTPMFDLLEQVIRDANAIGQKVKDATSGRSEAIAGVLNTSEDGKVAEWRAYEAKITEQIARAQEALAARKKEVTEYAESLLNSAEDFDVEEGKKEFLARRKKATDTQKALVTLLTNYGAGNASEIISEEMETRGITEIVGLGGQRKPGSGQKRPRLSAATVNGEPARTNQNGVPTFTTIAQHISAEYGATNAEDLKAAAFAAAGTDDLSTVSEFSFTFALPAVLAGKPESAKSVLISVTPKGAEVEADEEDSDEE